MFNATRRTDRRLRAALLLLVGVVAALPWWATLPPDPTAAGLDPDEVQLVALINDYRARLDPPRPALTVSASLSHAARSWARTLTASALWPDLHDADTPSGRTTVSSRAIAAGYPVRAAAGVAETVAIIGGARSRLPAELPLRSWLDASGTADRLARPDARAIGVAFASGSNSAWVAILGPMADYARPPGTASPEAVAIPPTPVRVIPTPVEATLYATVPDAVLDCGPALPGRADASVIPPRPPPSGEAPTPEATPTPGSPPPPAILSGSPASVFDAPFTGAWTPMPDSGPPIPENASVTWTGRELLVWGGYVGVDWPPSNGGPWPHHSSKLLGGASFDPVTGTWRPLPEEGAPCPTVDHVALWTGTEWLIWGGQTGPGNPSFNGGARYRPDTRTWSPISVVGAPSPRFAPAAAWTGSEMLIWSGQAPGCGWRQGITNFFSCGERYGGPVLRDGAAYSPATDTWRPLAVANAPQPRTQPVAVWTGQEMLVWGGEYPVVSNDGRATTLVEGGASYDPVRDAWTPFPDEGAASPRWRPEATWTGRELLIRGGVAADRWHSPDRDARYDPRSNSWKPMATPYSSGAFVGRSGTVSVWTGKELLVWGGTVGRWEVTDRGARYDPAHDAWTPMTRVGAPSPRSGATGVWTGREFLVWGEYRLPTRKNLDVGGGEHMVGVTGVHGDPLWNGARYDPVEDVWNPLPDNGGPSAYATRSFWTGTEWIVLSTRPTLPFATASPPGARYRPPRPSTDHQDR